MTRNPLGSVEKGRNPTRPAPFRSLEIIALSDSEQEEIPSNDDDLIILVDLIARNTDFVFLWIKTRFIHNLRGNAMIYAKLGCETGRVNPPGYPDRWVPGRVRAIKSITRNLLGL